MLDPKEEKKWQEYLMMCKELKIPSVPFIFINVEKYNKHGEMVKSDIERAHSWTRNLYNLIFETVSAGSTSGTNNFGAGYMTGKTTGGSVHYVAGYDMCKSSGQMNAGIVNTGQTSSFGLVVGSSTTAFDEDHYAMQSVIAHGTGSGQLYYYSMGRPYTYYTAGSKTWTTELTRFFENMDTASITIKEAGLYWYGYLCTSSQSVYMVERTVLASTIALAQGEIAKIKYTITMDFSAID